MVYIGLEPNTKYLSGVLPLNSQGYILVNEKMKTETPGIFAAGDIRGKSVWQIATAVGDGATAAISAERFLVYKGTNTAYRAVASFPCFEEAHPLIVVNRGEPGCKLIVFPFVKNPGAFECYEKGILTKKDTDRLELKWGNADAAITLLNKMIKREGFGAVLADGPKEAAKRIGGDALKFVVHVKGGGMNMHDWRVSWSTLFGQIISSAGPCWQGSGVVAFSPEPDLSYKELSVDPVSAEGKAEAVWKTQQKKSMEDSIGICWFAGWGVPGSLNFERRAIAATTGWKDFTVEEALTVGRRIITLQRLFNIKHGLTVQSDLDVGQRLLDPPTAGPAKGKGFAEHLPSLLREYYSLSGWDPGTGKPLPATIKDLQLEEEAKRL